MNKEILFKESQRFRQWWLWLILLVINGLLLFGVFQQVIGEKQFGDKPMNDTGLLMVAGFTLLLAILFASFRLDTEIKQDGIYVRFFPFQWAFKKYSWDKVSKSYVKQYNPLADFGGWGIRFGFFGNKGKALTVSGNRGLQLVMTDGTKLLIGTKNPEKATDALRRTGHLKE